MINSTNMFYRLRSSRISKYFEAIELLFNKNQLTLSQMIIKESETDKTIYSFSIN